jgi:uroporphyrinogen-III synthase
MCSDKILFTADKDLAASFLEMEEIKHTGLLHLPLEQYVYDTLPEESKGMRQILNHYLFIIHGNLRNARFFSEWMDREQMLSEVQKKVNIATDMPTAHFLEKQEIPAVTPRPGAKPIDVVEFLLRISQKGRVLYPTTDQKTEEIPGLLQELEMPVTEFQVCREQTIEGSKLVEYREIVQNSELKAVLFHNRSSVIRIQTAFPELNFSEITTISGGTAISEKLNEAGIETALEANGSWESAAKLIKKICSGENDTGFSA